MRINDVGGMEGFGDIAVSESDPPFEADWEAHVYALNVALVRRGVYSLDEFRDAIERMAPQVYLGTSYYERWFDAITGLLRERGVVGVDALSGTDAHAHDE
jgi:nitrile hydratase